MDTENYKKQLSQFIAYSSILRSEFFANHSYPCLEDDTKQAGFNSAIYTLMHGQ
jgi:hypothetical protein